MSSIRGKLFLWMVSLAISSVFMLIFLNSFFFRSYYLSLKEQELTGIFAEISDIKTRSHRELKKVLNPIEDKHGLDIIIYDKDNSILYSTHRGRPFPKKPHELRTIKSRQLPGGALLELERDRIIKLENLCLRGRLGGTYEIILHMPLSAMNMTVSILNKFSIIAGSILLLLAIIFAYYISGYLSAPIKKISSITKKMAELDFSEKVEIQGQDETVTLAHNVNILSDSLRISIEKLNDKNRQLAEDIREMNRLDEKRRELLRNVSHELKTPIALIMGYAEALNMNLSEQSERRNFYSAVVMDEAKKMNSLVESLLNIHQIEFGDIKLNRIKTDLPELVTDIYRKYDRIFEEKGIETSIENRADGTVYADPLMLESVCTNLINNGISHIYGGKELKITVENKENKMRIGVFNSSMPLKDDELEKIWDSFYKTDKSRSRDKGGYGLGLSIVKAILNAHEYSFGVNNVPNGILFWFEAPLYS